MELVYLWIKEYKNIKRQGFNFSPRFKCEFDGENLTITENEDYVSIFPDNINITAIVGENGSGKSSALVGITNHKAIFKINNEYFSRGFEITKITAPITIKPIDENIVKDIDEAIIYLDYDLIKINPIRDDWDYLGLNIYDKNLYKEIENNISGASDFNVSKFRENFFNLIVEHHKKFKLNIFTYNPIEISFNDYLYEEKSQDEKWLKINDFIKNTEKHPFSKDRFLIFLLSNLSRIQDVDLNTKLLKIIDTNNLLSHIEIITMEYSKYYEKINFENIYLFFDAFNKFDNKKLISISEFHPIYETYKDAYLELFKIKYLQIDLIDAKKRFFFDLSQGERKFFTESLMVFNTINKNVKNNILLVLDEPDLTLHPDWQKKYIIEMIKLLSNFPKKKFHLIITSHSPFILSDLPKENVIFLEKGKQVKPFKTNEQTFGANIHTLLSHGFFMSDGLMGEFAKSKINEIKEFYDENKDLEKDDSNYQTKKEEFLTKKKDFENIQRIIGEPFLQTIMKNYLDELEILFNGKKEFLKNEIKRLQDLEKSLDD